MLTKSTAEARIIKLLKNCTYLDKKFNIKTGDILIEDGIIIDIEENIEKEKSQLEESMDCKDYLIMPGFVNGHTHNPSTLYRGLFKDKPLSDWLDNSYQGKLQNKGFEFLDDKVNREEFHVLLLKSYSEYMRQGITTVIESGQSDREDVINWTEDVLRTANLRGVIDVYDEIDNYYNNSDEYVKYCTHLPEEEQIVDSLLPELKNQKETYPSLRMTHCLETLNRKKIVNHKYHKSTVELFDDFNLLDKNTVLFHCTYVNNDDIELIADRQASIVYCPVSNYWSGAGYAPAEKFLQEDINILLGTDFLLTDLWEVMRNAYYYLKTHTEPERYTAKDIFKMVTVNAYRVIAPEMKIGKIDVDYKADLQFINKNDTQIWPLLNKNGFSNILHNLLMHGNASMVQNLMINGKWVLKDNKIIPFDENFILVRYRHILQNLYGF